MVKSRTPGPSPKQPLRGADRSKLVGASAIKIHKMVSSYHETYSLVPAISASVNGIFDYYHTIKE